MATTSMVPEKGGAETAGHEKREQTIQMLTHLAGVHRDLGDSLEEAGERLAAANRVSGSPLDEQQLKALLRKAYGEHPLLDPPFSDLGNAKRVLSLYGDRIRYLPHENQWLIWSGGPCWNRDNDAVKRCVYAMTEELARAAAGVTNKKRRAAYEGWATKSGDESRVRSALESASSQLTGVGEPVSLAVEDVDSRDMLINLANGIYCVESGSFQAPRRELLLTRHMPVRFDPKATAPTWERAVSLVLGGDIDKVEYFRRAGGYMMTGSTREDLIFHLVGNGANGKSVLVNTMAMLWGDYHKRAQADTFARGKTGVRADLARLEGARLVTVQEPNTGMVYDEGLVKQLSGRDSVTADYKYRDHFEFVPRMKLLMSCNSLPEIKGRDYGIWRRMVVLDFPERFSNDPQQLKRGAHPADPELESKLRAELPGILNWFLQGAVEWKQNGLGTCSAVEQRKDQYQREMDPTGQFLEEHVTCTHRDRDRVEAGHLYEAFKQWCSKSGIDELGKKEFGMALDSHGVHKKKSGCWWRTGILLKHMER